MIKTISKHSGRIEITPALKTLQIIKNTWKSAFAAACKYDNIDTTSSFVVFSESNPFVKFVNNAAAKYFEVVSEYKAGGYIGLTLS